MYRRALVLQIAADTLWAAEMPDLYWHPSMEASRLKALRENAKRAEALTAVILTRVGLSWDALGAEYDITRQALHRRLANAGERLYQDGRRYDYRRDVVNALELINSHVSGVELKDIEAEEAERTNELVGLRQVPHWWAN